MIVIGYYFRLPSLMRYIASKKVFQWIQLSHSHQVSILINILKAAITRVDPKSAKRHWWLDCLYALLGSTSVKASCKNVG